MKNRKVKAITYRPDGMGMIWKGKSSMSWDAVKDKITMELTPVGVLVDGVRLIPFGVLASVDLEPEVEKGKAA